MKKRKAEANGHNIVIADYIEENNFVPILLYLNYSGRTPMRMHACEQYVFLLRLNVAMLFFYVEEYIV